MNQTAQHIPPNPARDFANAILAETNGAQDLIELLHEISQGRYGANLNDRIAATNTLMDRGFGKCPKQTPAGDDSQTADSNTTPVTDDNDTRALRESHSANPHAPRLVTRSTNPCTTPWGLLPARIRPPTIPPASPTHTLSRTASLDP